MDDAQDVPPCRGDGGEYDQDDSVEPRHARPGDGALKDGDLVAEQGDLCEQRPARAKGVRHGGGEHEESFEHGRSKVMRRPGFPVDPGGSQDGYGASRLSA